MIKFKEFLRECSFIKEQSPGVYYQNSQDYQSKAAEKLSKNDYRRSIGLPDEDEIPEAEDIILKPTTQGIQRSVEDEARRRMDIEDTLSIPVEPPFLLPNDTDTTRERQDKLRNRIIKSLSNTEFAVHDMRKIEQHNRRRLKQTTDNIVNDRKSQLPDLAKEQDKLSKAAEELKQQEKFVSNLSNMVPYEAPRGTTKIVNYIRNFLNSKHSGIMSDWNVNTAQQEEMPWSNFYGTRNNPHTNPDFEQTRTYTVDSDLGPQQENEQGIRLGRVDYSIRNK